MSHLQFQLTVPSDKVFFFEEFLGDAVESMWWGEDGLVTGIITAESRKDVEEKAALFFQEIGQKSPNIQFSPLEERDWLQEDQLKLSPIEVGPFFIYPPHYEGKVPPGKKGFKIDSPHAFGSGHHETTRSCLSMLHDLSKDFHPRSVLDVGCGSGILAMAAAHFWKCKALATDCDLLSVSHAKRNLEENGVSGVEVVECFGLDHPFVLESAPYDLIVANIHSHVLIELAEEIAKCLDRRGYVLLSGILSEQEQEVVRAYRNLGIAPVNTVLDGKWATLLLKREA